LEPLQTSAHFVEYGAYLRLHGKLTEKAFKGNVEFCLAKKIFMEDLGNSYIMGATMNVCY